MLTKTEEDIGARIYMEHGQYEVWIGPASDLESNNVINAFVAGIGSTRDAAVTEAVGELEAVLERLQGPPALITVVDFDRAGEAGDPHDG